MQNPWVRRFTFASGVVLVFTIFAYGFWVTDVNLEQARSEDRLTQLTRILRALAQPDILEYDQEETDVDFAFYLPCPETGFPESAARGGGPHMVVTPICAGPGEIITIEGFNFMPDTRGPVNFVAQSGAKLQLGNFQVDPDGHWSIRAELPNRQPIAEAQLIQATARQNVGLPRASSTAEAVFEKIVETVFLALLATTFGGILAVPISFLAARNLMSDVKAPLTSIALMLLGWPLGIWLGFTIASLIGQFAESSASDSPFFNAGITLSLAAASVVAVSRERTDLSGLTAKIGRGLLIAAAGVLTIVVTYLIAYLAMAIGDALIEPLGPLGFLGNFVFQLGDALWMLTPGLAAFVAGAALGSLGGRLGQQASDRLDPTTVKLLNAVAAALAGAALFALIGAALKWFYQIADITRTFVMPTFVGAVLGVLLSIRVDVRQPLPIGSWIYYVLRTILNAVRSIEAIIMVIVFVVWVGIGPFAGALALTLHTIAALGKLFSEQVESIAPGPLEAVQATGANRAQVIRFAVIPQVIPPYISFLMYRWDINVRMSTIIGFAGGGGIGFLLQNYVRILDYRGAAAAMLAIALVVATMDYVSSAIRQRYV
ncbi:MAG: ABC transporter permease subunit [Anaerolineales bacterium]